MWESGIYVLRRDGWVVEDRDGNRVFVCIAEDIASDDEELDIEAEVEFHRESRTWRFPES